MRAWILVLLSVTVAGCGSKSDACRTIEETIKDEMAYKGTTGDPCQSSHPESTYYKTACDKCREKCDSCDVAP